MTDAGGSPIIHFRDDEGKPICHQRGVNLRTTNCSWEVICSTCRKILRREKEDRKS